MLAIIAERSVLTSISTAFRRNGAGTLDQKRAFQNTPHECLLLKVLQTLPPLSLTHICTVYCRRKSDAI